MAINMWKKKKKKMKKTLSGKQIEVKWCCAFKYVSSWEFVKLFLFSIQLCLPLLKVHVLLILRTQY